MPVTALYSLSLHDALPISPDVVEVVGEDEVGAAAQPVPEPALDLREKLHADQPADAAAVEGQQSLDRKSTRLNSSHTVISYAVFCLKKKTVKAAECMSFTL